MRLRVLTISKPYVAAAYRAKLAALAAEADLEIGLVCPPAWGAQRYEDAGAEPFWSRRVGIVLNGRNHLHVYRGLADAVRDFAPHVLNVEEEHYSLVTWQAFRIARAVGAAPVFYTWQNIAKTYPPPFSWIERLIFSTAAGAVAGNAEAGEVLRAKGYAGPLWEIPQMGVELQRFAPAASDPEARAARRRELGLERGAVLAGFFGRLVEEKGVQDLLRAVARLAADGVDARALIVGDGPHAPALRALAADLGVADRTRFLASVPSRDVAAYLQAIDALCLPSLTRGNWKEQFGRVLIEAMAAEAVCVGSSSGEIPRVIEDAGLVVPEGDAAALAVALRRLAEEPGLAATLRGRGAVRVRARYANEVVAGRFAAVFRAAAAAGAREYGVATRRPH